MLVLLIVRSIKFLNVFDIYSWHLIHCGNLAAYAPGPITYYAMNKTQELAVDTLCLVTHCIFV
jgi:hypothetical protein